ncbi:MAG TPA: PIN domain-containing protein [Thermoanaerobaculia bacterium]|nr:PIN domain-containing protein [Thermoanaerobaculia bacterium]
MNVFVETNFVIEVALEQQEAASCEAFLHLANTNAIRLSVPAYSFIEPHEMLTRRHLDRESLRSRVSNELAQLARSTPLTERVAASQEIVKLMVDSVEYERKRISEVKERLWSIGEVLPLDAAVLQSAVECQNKFDLSPQDAVVYASIRAKLVVDHAATSCFVSRNPGDFDDPDLRQDLAALNCKYFSSFDTALQYVRHSLGLTPTVS